MPTDYSRMSHIERSRYITEDEARNEPVLVGLAEEDRTYVYFLYHVKKSHDVHYLKRLGEDDGLASRENLQEIASYTGLSIIDALEALGVQDPRGYFF